MNRAAHNAGVSIRQLAEVTGLGRKIVAAVVSDTPSES
jgi:DNA uptake protein ComE-like DNA-binding protein